MDTYLVFGLFPKEIQNDVYKNSKRDIQNAANMLQWNIVKALDEATNDNNKYTIINSMYVPSFPKGYKKLFIPSFTFSHKEGAIDYNVGFFNPFLLASQFKFWSLASFFKKKLNKKLNHTTIVIYALTLPFAKLCKYLKKKYKNIQICAIVPDLPQYMDTQSKKKKWYKRIIKNNRIKTIYKCTKYIDKYILLTESMKDDLKANKFLVMEGIAPYFKQFNYFNHEKKIILYAGTLNKKYGILDLIEAFNIASAKNDKLELQIYGYGDSITKILESSKLNNNIKYCGNITPLELERRILQSDILVNPRKNNEIFTKYSFPSKNLDYLSYGIPFIGFKLDGIPKEYFSIMIVPDSESNDDLAKKIIEVAAMNYEQRIKYYEKAKNFIINNKSCYQQGKRIVRFLNEG